MKVSSAKSVRVENPHRKVPEYFQQLTYWLSGGLAQSVTSLRMIAPTKLIDAEPG